MTVPEIDHFAAGARAYCEFVETAHKFPLNERLVMFASLLADLYAAALRLPDVEPTDQQVPPAPGEVPGWAGFDDLTLYWEVSDPYEWEAPVCGSLSDDLMDVYRDLQPGLIPFDGGDVNTAVRHWRSNFGAHWGEHAVDALRALHRAMRRIANET